jgi:hypothetical protein
MAFCQDHFQGANQVKEIAEAGSIGSIKGIKILRRRAWSQAHNKALAAYLLQ